MKNTYHALQLRMSRTIRNLEREKIIEPAAKIKELKALLKGDKSRHEEIKRKYEKIASDELKRGVLKLGRSLGLKK